MLRGHRTFLIPVLLLTAIPVVRLCAWKGVGQIAPAIQAVSPVEAVAGNVVTVSGFQLDSRHVAELYLMGGEDYYKVSILTQSDRAISFRVPEDTAPGVLGFAIKLAGGTELIDQPVFLRIFEATLEPAS
jgi:hypothetical protein